MKIIAIKFGDNDFGYTIRAFLENIHRTGISSYSHLNKEQMAQLFNKTIYALYLLVQNRLEYEDSVNIQKYLQIEPRHIYFDDEVAAFLAEEGNRNSCNSDFFVLDTQNYQPYIYSV